MDNFFALIIGVGGTDIPETVKDAEAIHNVLTTKGAYNPLHTYYLTDHKSTRDNIINAFDEIIKKSEETIDATVFIYYSGHGQRFPIATSNDYDYYLVTYGGDYNNKEKTMLNGDIFSEKIENIKAKRILVMLDCCHAGGIKKGGLKTKGGEMTMCSNRTLQEKLKSGKGRVFVSSCDDNETSVILPNAKYSLFTEVALEVLNGFYSPLREYVSVLDLIYHVLIEVPNRIQKFKHHQNPILTEAINLNHKYHVCKNGEWKPRDYFQETITEQSKKASLEENYDKNNFEEYIQKNKPGLDDIYKSIDKERVHKINPKSDLINEIDSNKGWSKKLGSTSNDKDKTKQSTEVNNNSKTVKEEYDADKMLDFIKNYLHKI
ncbi:caspase family protein [Flavihumibacter sp.]|uniref:caspase family protein n=1 Tax=Flavihumibacter sp. TaxID=1913981 RepID=UPI002FCC0D7C